MTDQSQILIRPRVRITIDGEPVTAVQGTTILQACRNEGLEIPTMCYGDTITPKNACRLCMVEVDGSRTLVPSCSRKVESGMNINTNTPRVQHSRKLVLELLGSSVDISLMQEVVKWIDDYQAKPTRMAGETIAQKVKIDNPLYVRDYSKCILCYQCVDACGSQWQNTFAIATSHRGFKAMISTEFEAPLTDSACVYCGNCIQVCPSGALMFRSEYEMRLAGEWDETIQSATDTICPYCGVGCAVTLHVQDESIVKVTSPSDHSVTHGNLCIKGRFGFQHVQN